ncbi:MAG: RidA family protein [Candidatus Dormibacteria bacterium]
MAEVVEARLAELGLVLPAAASINQQLSYRRMVRHGDVAYLSGHLPLDGGDLLHPGLVGEDVGLEEAVAAARATALSMLRTLKDELGSLDQVSRWLRVNAYVHCGDGFGKTPQVANGFTDLVRDLWGAEALGSRSAVGVSDLPLDTCFEADAIVELHPGPA